MLKQSKMLSSRAAMVLVRAAENEMLQPHTEVQVQLHKDHKYRDLFPSPTSCHRLDLKYPGNKQLYTTTFGSIPLPHISFSSSTAPSTSAALHSPWTSVS